MKKLLVAGFVPILLCITAFSFCGCEKEKLTIAGDESLLAEPLKKSYAAGETVTVKIGLIMDADVVVKLNGTTLRQTSVRENDRYSHNECTFAMPDKDSTLELRISGGMRG